MSKGSDNLAQKLGQFLERYNLNFKKEVCIGKNKARYDFFIETSTPIALEFDGENHFKPNSHFFKTTESFDNYKKNDNAKNELSRLGKVHLIRTTNEKLTLIELEKLFEGFEYLLEEGATDATDKKESYEEKRKAYKKAASDYRHEQYLKFAEKKRAATKARKISEADSKRNKKN